MNGSAIATDGNAALLGIEKMTLLYLLQSKPVEPSHDAPLPQTERQEKQAEASAADRGNEMSELTKQQLAALVDVAKKNPEWALQQAFRFGVASAQSEPMLESIKRAAEILDYNAESIKQSYDGSMTEEAKQEVAELKKVVKALRSMEI